MVQLWRALLKGKAKIAQYQLVFAKRHSKTKGNWIAVKGYGYGWRDVYIAKLFGPTILEMEEILRIYIFQSLSSVEATMYHKDAG